MAKKESRIIPTVLTPDDWEPQMPFDHPGTGPKPETLRKVGIERVLGRKVSESMPCVGTYGMGGPGFIGFVLEPSIDYPQQEFLVLCIWGASDWIEVDGKRYEDIGKDYHERSKAFRDINGTISVVDVQDKSCKLKIGQHEIVISERPEDRPKFGGTGELRKFYHDDSLLDAWVVSKPSTYWV